LDEQFKYYSGGFEQVGSSGATTIHVRNNLTVTKSGYLYIYTSNEATNIDVFFDNLQVTHIRGSLVEETHYYPGGLTMSGINSKALSFGNPPNQNKFTGIELDEELDVNWYQFKYRNHDPQIGRFLQIDPLASDYVYNSTYAYAENKPINGIDLEGLEWASKYKWSDQITDQTHINTLGSNYKKGMTYQDAWAVMAPQYLENKLGQTFDCANLSITVMTEFAFNFSLPVHIADYKAEGIDPTLDNDNFGYTNKAGKFVELKQGDWKGLADVIAAYYGAADLFNNRKLTTVGDFDDLKAGDMVGWDYPNGNVFHNQTVTKVEWIDKPGGIFNGDWHWGPDYAEYTTIQGSLSGSNGIPAERKTYNVDKVKKDGNGSGATTRVLQWNFSAFDKNFKRR
jgi:RHS repeat-associated protein